MARLYLVCLLIGFVCVVCSATPTTKPTTTARRPTPSTTRSRTSIRTTQRTTVRPSSTTWRPNTYYYYMDSGDCTPYANTKYLTSKRDVAYIKAWNPYSARNPVRSCSYTISGYALDELQFHFANWQMSTCGVTVNVYDGSSTYGSPMYTFTCATSYSSYSRYRTTTSNYVTIELVNSAKRTDFDFSLYVTSYDQYRKHTDSVVAWSVGVSVAFIICGVVLIVCLRRRRRFARLIGPALITTTTTTNNYPTGQAPYNANYGSVSGDQYPSAVAPPPAQGYPGYPQAGGGAPQPPVYSEKGQPAYPPAGANPPPPSGAYPYQQPPAYGNAN